MILNIIHVLCVSIQEVIHVNGLKGWFLWSTPAVSGFAGDLTSLACDIIYCMKSVRALFFNLTYPPLELISFMVVGLAQIRVSLNMALYTL